MKPIVITNQHTQTTAKVYRTPVEYVVKLYDINGKLVKGADYFTDNKADAIGTAHAMLTANSIGF